MHDYPIAYLITIIWLSTQWDCLRALILAPFLLPSPQQFQCPTIIVFYAFLQIDSKSRKLVNSVCIFMAIYRAKEYWDYISFSNGPNVISQAA